MTIRHHDLCFGCGQANLFGLQLELERRDHGAVQGRFFVKQDHQGLPGFAHGGILGAALDEAMSLAAGEPGEWPWTAHVELDLRAPAPVGGFVRLEARVERREEGKTWVTSAAYPEEGEGEAPLAQARALLVLPRPG